MHTKSGRKGSEFQLWEDFVKLSTVKLSIFSLIFAVAFLRWIVVTLFDFYRLVPGVIFYLQLIGVKSIKQTYFHLHFTQHDGTVAFCYKQKLTMPSRLGRISSIVTEWNEYLYICFIFIAIIINWTMSFSLHALIFFHEHWTAWQVTYTLEFRVQIFQRLEFMHEKHSKVAL